MEESVSISNEQEIILKIVAGEPALFEVLIRRYNPVLYKIARSFGFNHQDAEDLMQETHFNAYKELKSFGFRSTYKTWVSKIMIHHCQYKKKWGYYKNEVPDSENLHENVQPMFASNKKKSEKEIMNRELSKFLEASLQAIPEIYRTVFILREAEQFSVAETAGLLNLSEVNVKVRLNRAKAMLQKELEKYYSTTELFEFNLVYCDKMVQKVFERIQHDK
jgi:RNA polymerase sigma factor (sigma-70 family)